jgi:hypothetical protein
MASPDQWSLGTLVGLYETAWIAVRGIRANCAPGHRLTTIRRASEQVNALYLRKPPYLAIGLDVKIISSPVKSPTEKSGVCILAFARRGCRQSRHIRVLRFLPHNFFIKNMV